MYQHISHIDNVTPRYFRMAVSEIFGQKIGSLTYDHNVVNNGMIAHDI